MHRTDGQPVGIVVSVADDHLDGIDEVVAGLRAAGMRVDGVLDTVGMVTGSAAPDSLDALQSVPGVADVERQHHHQHAPPESDIQ
ncbi:hypothetical protein [Actinophytocola sp.]|uniref:hypothetical protein n=1 Tax=Actinophytocola sp. TaxID=1872138 RepID=UPI002D7F04B1|nr:hypothetical protein [Actinophytocola sp.]HET9142844.1 hypothetical protein [Actinophytocola sp.]